MAKFKSASNMTDAENRARQEELRKPKKRTPKVASEDEKVRARQANAQARGQSPRGSRTPKPKVSLAEAQNSRVTSGNKTSATLRTAFKGARDAARGGAAALGEGLGAGVAETAGIAKEGVKGFAKGSGLTGQAADAVKAGASKAEIGLKAAKNAAKSLPGKIASGLGSVAKFAGSKILGPTGVIAGGVEGVRNTPVGDFPEIAARGHPMTAPVMTLLDKARGLSTFDSAKRQFSASGGQALGDVPNPLFETPKAISDVTSKSLGELTGLNQFVGDQDKQPVRRTTGEGIQDPRVASEGIPGSGLLDPNRDPTRQASFATQTPGGDTQQAGTPETGSGVPKSGTGFFTNAAGQRTNIGTPNAASEPGLRAAQQEETAPTQNEEILQKLSDQAREGGIASAFGGLAAGGNVLREQAANRQRQFQTQENEQTQQNKIDIELTKGAIAAKADGPEREKAFNEESRKTLEDLTAAEGADDGGKSLNRLKDNLAANSIRDINGPQAAIFSGLVSDELTEFVEGKGVLDLLGLGPGRNLFEKITESEEPILTLNPENGVFFDRAKGAIMKRSETAGKPPQRVVDLDGLPKRTQDFLRAKGKIFGKNREGELGLRQGGIESSGRFGPQPGLGQ